ncbi:MAG TPA: lipocalin-like domain-containing protein [Chthoniobacterales bacterium]|nr:lipocalin-like domain-containing protein [Chthoniobacterales bacterium]
MNFRFSILDFRLLAITFAVSAVGAEWRNAEPGWRYEFPRDHRVHREFKTEWWYFTGNLFDSGGHRFGYELTFFRQGIQPSAVRDPKVSRFIVDDLKFAHFAITDVTGRKFQFDQRTSRGAFGEAGFDDGNRLAWIDNWTLTIAGGDDFDLAAATDFGALRLHLHATKPPVVHGENGVSVKAAEGSSASHYYSIPGLETSGEIVLNGNSNAVHGETWFDHEWSSSALGKSEVGWDWVCLQWDDGSELMLYRMRLAKGGVEPSSSGTWIAPDGTATHLRASDFQMTPTAFWKSKANSAQYPIGWRIVLPAQRAEFMVRAALDDQELNLGPITYWEGAVDATGSRDGKPITARGYLELTGYAGRLSDATGGSEGRAAARP